ncbi:MAG TPA: sugar ABC transporter permease [Actinomycetota bacterium]|jgi:multiple sugar transport system permease protein
MEAVAPGARGVAARGLRARLDNPRLLGAALITPAGLFVLALVGGPLLFSVWLSLTDATAGSRGAHFVGLANYRAAMADPVFRQSLGNTFLVTIVSQVLVLVLAKLLANYLAKPFRGKWALRALILLPWAAPISLGALSWRWIFDSLFSVLNWTLHALHLLPRSVSPQWLGEPALAKASIIAVQTWRILPFATVIILAGLSSIPPEVDDAARVDGAAGLRKLVHVTLPMILPVLTIALLFGIVFTATDMTVVTVLTRGGPFNSTHVLASWAYQTGILASSLGAGAAIAMFMFPLLVVVSVLMLRFARRTDPGTVA